MRAENIPLNEKKIEDHCFGLVRHNHFQQFGMQRTWPWSFAHIFSHCRQALVIDIYNQDIGIRLETSSMTFEQPVVKTIGQFRQRREHETLDPYKYEDAQDQFGEKCGAQPGISLTLLTREKLFHGVELGMIRKIID